MANPTAAKSKAEISKKTYTKEMEGIPTAHLLWHPTDGVFYEEEYPGQVPPPPHTISQLPTHLIHLTNQWYNHAFKSKDYIVAGTIAVADWDEIYTHKICIDQHVYTEVAIDAALATDLDTLRLVPFNSGDANVDAVRLQRAIYITPHFYP